MQLRTEKIRETVGVFENMDDLQNAVRELENTAFPRQDISVAATLPTDPVILEDDPDVPRNPPLRLEEETIATTAIIGMTAYAGAVMALMLVGIGSVLTVLMAVTLGALAAGVVSAVLVKAVGDRHEKIVEKQISKGGLPLWVRTPDPEREEIACHIMQAHGARHVKVHELNH